MSHEFLEVGIPYLGHLREIKEQYRFYPIDFTHPLHEEPVVSLTDYGVRGTSYYSRPNRASGDPLPGVNPDPLVRRTVAEKLARAKKALWESDALTRHVGGRAELIVRDALRSLSLQRQLHRVVLPRVLSAANPDWDEARLSVELPKVIAQPDDNPLSPAPHMTGAAVDVDLIREDGARIDFGHVLGTSASQTDYHEGYELLPEHTVSEHAQKVRRALYWTMSNQEFTNHPYEFWHYSYGDQMWALFTGESAAIYGAVNGSPDMQ